MKVLAKKAPAFLEVCPACEALLAFSFEDIYENRYIYCPICREKITTKIDLSYNGVVRLDDSASSGEK
jgi:DNA-directed RNA polymerase subunit RPC12/RpoP